jgi:spectrin beta
LEEAGDLHRFLRDLDHFQAWLTKTQTDVASEDIPASLAEAEKLLSQHQGIREEIDNYTDDYSRMMDYGERITAEETTSDDPQYMFLRERLKALRDGWEELHQMWENRQQLLSQSLNLQMFLRDAKQAEVLLAHQEHVLSKVLKLTTIICTEYIKLTSFCILCFYRMKCQPIWNKQRMPLSATKHSLPQWTPTTIRSTT